MKEINLLSQDTIDKIAAGEVIERPASVVKELVENAIDAGANAVTIEIRDGGTSFIRITDNGEGIDASQVRTAFLRHATSKIRSVDDLLRASSLGFRGEALSSICAVAQVELITKTAGSLTGTRYCIEGSHEKSMEEIGAPEGSTFLVRNLFYNTPARKKFLKSPTTEAGYVGDLAEHLALSHPEVSFKFITNGQTKLHTSGNNNLKDIIYGIYGREIAANLIEIHAEENGIKMDGFIGKPTVSRGNRNYENYYVNDRYVRSSIISKAIEEGYRNFMMQHRYPFTALHFHVDGSFLDINIHPTKMDIRFADNAAVYQLVLDAVRGGLTHRELIPKVTTATKAEERQASLLQKVQDKAEAKQYPEPFEKIRRSLFAENPTPYETKYPQRPRTPQPYTVRTGSLPEKGTIPNLKPGPVPKPVPAKGAFGKPVTDDELDRLFAPAPAAETKPEVTAEPVKPVDPLALLATPEPETAAVPKAEAEAVRPEPAAIPEPAPAPESGKKEAPVQMELFDDRLLSKKNVQEHKLIGQLFDTYWIVEFRNSLYIIDQHAAHEKVMYERLTARFQENRFASQQISPPMIISLTLQQEDLLQRYMEYFNQVGFEIEHFGGHEYSITGAPDGLLGLDDRDLFIQMLDNLSDWSGKPSIDIINEKLASMSCKAAVKGNNRLSTQEADALIKELLELENPYNCPHGRPTIIRMTKQELEKKFKRIV